MHGGLIAVLVALTACGRLAFEEAPVSTSDASAGDCPLLPCAGATTSVSCHGKCFATCSTPMSQAAAAEVCETWGGTLAALRDEQDQACLHALIDDDVWLGYAQASAAAQPELGWSWVDGAPPTYDNWRGGEPNDADGIEDGEENCALMFASGTWNDVQCDYAGPGVACSR